ncbi:NAD(P)-binding protein [Guyanagaster necrorhizus]|uniref:NAD(P)-binding protein n=1 Tax=Guyanagaster necrorhizus TaxID=856835 RepID=A0A9P7W5K6_9AGAR|nr:NAD(P)-binding protein [Guyanagaster necrorhizus MCA 3950]KAG7452355.1 NAD(P)-binding protein [Guyanagaster necrorhizus MCA 3950]
MTPIRFASTSPSLMAEKVVICGAGFIGKQIARTLTRSQKLNFCVQLSSRHPQKSYDQLKESIPCGTLLSPVSVDVRDMSSLAAAFEKSSLVISLIGIMHGSPKDFEDIQWRGASNVAKAAQSVGAKLVHFSSIGADPSSSIPYTRTKGLGEISVLEHCPSATVIRPSLVFGPEDDFFNRFSRLSQLLPFLPVFGGGTSRFQPVYVEDLARAVEIIATADTQVKKEVYGKIIEAGGPDVFTYRELMSLVLKYNGRHRPIVSLPFFVGQVQGFFLEKLPFNMFTVTRAQIEQLKSDNVVQDVEGSLNFVSFEKLLRTYCEPPRSVHDVLPGYLR